MDVPVRARSFSGTHLNPRIILETIWIVLGVGLLLLVFTDALWTTLWVDGGGGPLTSRTTTWAWKAVLAVIGRKHHHRLSLFGPSIVVMVVVTWVLLLWAGWVLIYASDPLTPAGRAVVPKNSEIANDNAARPLLHVISPVGGNDYMLRWQTVCIHGSGSGGRKPKSFAPMPMIV